MRGVINWPDQEAAARASAEAKLATADDTFFEVVRNLLQPPVPAIGTNQEVTVATTKNGFTNCDLYLDTRSNANMLGATLRIYAIVEDVRVLMVSASVGVAGAQRILNVAGRGVGRWEATIQMPSLGGMPGTNIPVPFSLVTYGVSASGGGIPGGDLGGSSIGSATVLTLTGVAGVVVSSAPVLQLGNTGQFPTTGLIRFPNTSGFVTLLAQRNAGNTLDMPILRTDANAFTMQIADGLTPNTAWSGVTIGAASMNLYTASATGAQFWNKSGTLTVPQITIFSGAGGLETLRIAGNGSTQTIIKPGDSTTAATGIKVTILGQTTTLMAGVGGDLELGPGGGAGSNGKLSLLNIITATTVGAAGAGAALPATPTGYISININGGAQKIPYYAP